MPSALWPKLTLNSVTSEHLHISFIESELRNNNYPMKISQSKALLSVKSDHIKALFILTFGTTGCFHGRWVTALISIQWLVYIIQ